MATPSAQPLTQVLEEVRRQLTVQNLERLSVMLEQKGGELRELFQLQHRSELDQIIKQLRSCKTLSGAHLDLIRKCVVGDAEYYAKLENDFENWRKELSRLLDEIAKYDGRAASGDEWLVFQGLIRDARMLLPSLKYFLECQDRVKRFEAAASDGIDVGEGNTLAGVLEQQLKSPDV